MAATLGVDLTLPPFPGASPSGSASGSGATIRVVNAWSQVEGAAPSIVLRTRDATLLTVAPGEVSPFIEVPGRQFGTGSQPIEILPDRGPDGTALSLGPLVPGDRVTAVAYGEIPPGGDVPILAMDPVWEQGEQPFGIGWPISPAGSAMLASFSGPLVGLGLDRSSVGFDTPDGTCLPNADGRQDNSFSGDGANYVPLPAGRTEIRFGSGPATDCRLRTADLGSVTIEASAGQRFGLVLWAPGGEHEFLVIDMGSEG